MACFPDQIGKQKLLNIRCKPCGHAVTWSQKKAVRLLGYSTGPMQARDLLKCSKCGASGVQVDFE